MNSSLVYGIVLMALHVLHAIVVVSNVNTSSSSGNVAKGQIYLKNHNMVILMTSWDMLSNQYFNNVWKLKKWKFVQYTNIYSNITTISVVQISNNESMHSENERIRAVQENSYTKTPATNMFPSISSIYSTSCEWTFKALIYRYITGIKRFNGKKKWKVRSDCIYIDFIKNGLFLKKNKNSNRLSSGEVEMMASHNQMKLQQVCRSGVSIQNPSDIQLHIQAKSNVKHKRLMQTRDTSPAILQTSKKKNVDRSYDKANPKIVCKYVVALLSAQLTTAMETYTLSDQLLLLLESVTEVRRHGQMAQYMPLRRKKCC
ncbi:hypothetical protein RFI_14016 [Reticulomyxa filosa]|uniref:Uncharacterized protein n=1 Tax=Reticulomyxa filosa TaxID=46433 RepID=X6NBL3_RETFI|nr:hypothetical protein RFI_14016 [Reticulomyxa filosa]|eukprot:ETO23169.1 hypothetical protein RFI_14016 [Reticulomyxa filosa]